LHQRQCERATKFWVGIQALPDTHPLRHLQVQAFQRFLSPLQKIAQAHQPMEEIETIQAFAVSPWEKRIDIIVKSDCTEAAKMATDAQGIVIATSSSEKNGIVGMGGAIGDTTTTGTSKTAPTATYSATIGQRDRFNPYFAELIAIATGLCNLATLPLSGRAITILSSNLSVLQAINLPSQQSGQFYIHQIYKSISKLKEMGNQISAIWAPQQEEIAIKAKAKAMAKQAT